MYILPQERPQNVNYGIVEFLKNDWDTLQICVRCKHSKPNMSYPKDEMDCIETGVFVMPYVLAIALRRIVKYEDTIKL